MFQTVSKYSMAPVQLVLKRIDNKESSAFRLADATITNGGEGSTVFIKKLNFMFMCNTAQMFSTT